MIKYLIVIEETRAGSLDTRPTCRGVSPRAARGKQWRLRCAKRSRSISMAFGRTGSRFRSRAPRQPTWMWPRRVSNRGAAESTGSSADDFTPFDKGQLASERLMEISPGRGAWPREKRYGGSRQIQRALPLFRIFPSPRVGASPIVRLQPVHRAHRTG